MGWGWARLIWTSTGGAGTAGYMVRVAKQETADGPLIWQGDPIDVGAATSVTITNAPGYWYICEIQAYDAFSPYDSSCGTLESMSMVRARSANTLTQ